jgi:hypothetical protein
MTDRKPTGYIRHDGTNYAAFLEPDIAEQRQRCKCCGAPLVGSVPARPEDYNSVPPKRAFEVEVEIKSVRRVEPQTWRDRDKLT